MFIDLLLCVIGIAALVYSADKLIEAASNFALNLKISKMAIGLSIIAVGTSLPELFVSINSSLKGCSALSLGNIVGSNIMNIALILGISAIILPINSTQEIVKREIPFMIAATSLFWIFARTDSRITPYEGIILIAVFVVYHTTIYLLGKKESKLTEEYIEETNKIVSITKWDIQEESSEEPQTTENVNETEKTDENSKENDNHDSKASNKTLRNILFAVGGLIGLIIGSELLVKSAINIAVSLGISTELIGLTLVALGTSIPELATSIIASKKGESEISVGNVLGSNIFNITVVVGITAIIPLFYQNPGLNLNLDISQQMLTINIPIVLVFSVILLPIMLTDMMISRKEGVFFLIIYICYTIMLIQNTVNPPDTNKQNSVPVVQEEATNLPTASSPIQLPSK
ncbi:MAG: calcium/sodium antiporter [Candidatus Riflebacteria bacterium]|nr:calcium/sodium antiporter [Candidatus Riflebacteria bacterium]